MDSTSTQRRSTYGGAYTPGHDAQPNRTAPDPLQRAVAIASILAFAVSLIGVIVSTAVAQARVDAKLETKVDAVEYQKDRQQLTQKLGDINGELRAIRCILRPEGC